MGRVVILVLLGGYFLVESTATRETAIKVLESTFTTSKKANRRRHFHGIHGFGRKVLVISQPECMNLSSCERIDDRWIRTMTKIAGGIHDIRVRGSQH
jgi:hypothetical protein